MSALGIIATIPGKPMGEPRARIGRLRNGRPIAFTPEKSKSYRALVQHYVGEEMRKREVEAHQGPVRVEITTFAACPKSHHRKREPIPEGPCTSKPDADNIAKIVCDALNGVAWHDDAQVVELIVVKRVAAQGHPPRVVVRISEWSESTLVQSA